jgi:hypothetical protein
MKAADFVKQKGDKKLKSSEVKGKKGALIDWIGKRRSAKNNKQEASDGEEE